jgi:hypothetical protein
MATWISDLAQPLGQASGIVLASTILIAGYSIYRYSASDAEYPNFPFVGKDKQAKDTWQLKMRWVKEAKRLIYDTLSKVPGFQQIL